MAGTDGTGRPSIVDRFACAADGHEVRGTWVACCQCGQQADMVSLRVNVGSGVVDGPR